MRVPIRLFRSTTRLDRRAAAVVEMALVLPVFLLIVLGIVEFGRAMMVGQLLTNGARHGARRAIIEGSTNTGVENEITDFLTTTLNVPASALTIVIDVEPGPSNPDPADNLAVAQPKDLVKVTVTVPFDQVAYIAGNFLGGTMLRGQCSMRHE
ncbi:MAG: TadE/TadG family type IV pilus assembly protein [Planctomycetaceae bacterium]